MDARRFDNYVLEAGEGGRSRVDSRAKKRKERLLKLEQDLVTRYAQERFILDRESVILVESVYHDFTKWLRAQGEEPWTFTLVGLRFSKNEYLYHKRVMKRRARFPEGLRTVWQGVRIKEEEIKEDEAVEQRRRDLAAHDAESERWRAQPGDEGYLNETDTPDTIQTPYERQQQNLQESYPKYNPVTPVEIDYEGDIYEVIPIFLVDEQGICFNSTCNLAIPRTDPAFVDVETNTTFCQSCMEIYRTTNDNNENKEPEDEEESKQEDLADLEKELGILPSDYYIRETKPEPPNTNQ